MDEWVAKEWIRFVKEENGRYVINPETQPRFWEAVEARLVYGEKYDISVLIRGDINQSDRVVLDEYGNMCSIQQYGSYGASSLNELLERICQDIIIMNEIF